ncbi:MAG: hypothetical protein HY580_02620 [Nitrospinae bacterium]|nr:hypothetical protein [Nitrospinota bacterium]
MEEKLQAILEKIRALEYELFEELQKKEKEFYYEVKEKRVKFQQEIRKYHKTLTIKVRHYLRDAAVMNIVTAPVIYSCIFPALFMDVMISLYQAICFPVYGIPKVRRSDYIVIDRHYLSYLNAIEKLNCVYCGYFNGLAGYVREIAARTEQYWCPIKHARKHRAIHGRYKFFLEYGDAESYRKEIEKVRRSFDDLKKEEDPETQRKD